MPSKVAALLEEQDLTSVNVLLGVVPVLAFLLKREEDVEMALLCDSAVKQVFKLSKEGGHFCGYRNMQMMASTLDALPNVSRPRTEWTIPKLQRSIEKAWDEGHHACGRAHIGSIIGTRKHVGTPEAAALFSSLDKHGECNTFTGKHAWQDLLDYVEDYFLSCTCSPDDGPDAVVHKTWLPPIFLQRRGHSLTIVGIERRWSGARRLLVFDPAWRPPKMIEQALDENTSAWRRRYMLRRYRKNQRYLRRFRDFETLVAL